MLEFWRAKYLFCSPYNIRHKNIILLTLCIRCLWQLLTSHGYQNMKVTSGKHSTVLWIQTFWFRFSCCILVKGLSKLSSSIGHFQGSAGPNAGPSCQERLNLEVPSNLVFYKSVKICWPGHTTTEKNRIQRPDRYFWKRKSYFNYLTIAKWHWERACLSLAAVTSHPGRSMCISKTYVYSIRKKKKIQSIFFTLPLHQPCKYITYYKVPIAFPLARYLQTGEPKGVVWPWQEGQLSRRQVKPLPKSHWKPSSLNERLVTNQAQCHQPWLLHLQKTTWSHKALSLGLQRAPSQMSFANTVAKKSTKKVITRLKHHLLMEPRAELWSIPKSCPSLLDEQLTSLTEDADTEHIFSQSQIPHFCPP